MRRRIKSYYVFEKKSGFYGCYFSHFRMPMAIATVRLHFQFKLWCEINALVQYCMCEVNGRAHLISRSLLVPHCARLNSYWIENLRARVGTFLVLPSFSLSPSLSPFLLFFLYSPPPPLHTYYFRLGRTRLESGKLRLVVWKWMYFILLLYCSLRRATSL